MADNNLDINQIKEIVELMKENDLSAFKLEQGDFKLEIEKGGPAAAPVVSHAAPVPQPIIPATPPIELDSNGGAFPASAEPKGNFQEITAPMVGTVYHAPSPEAPPFVKPGDQVTEDTVVCIVEAMKVMNEIKAELKGTVDAVLVENGAPVQYGQPLFRLRLS